MVHSKIHKNADGSWNLSGINTAEDLDNEIAYLKNKINSGFQKIKTDTAQIPKQAVKASVGKAFPFLDFGDTAAKNTAGIATSLLGRLTGMLLNKKKGAASKARLTGTVKGIGIAAAVQGGLFLFNVFNKWNKRRKIRKELRELKVKTEILKLLKEDIDRQRSAK